MSAAGLATCLVLVAGMCGAARPALAWLQARRGRASGPLSGVPTVDVDDDVRVAEDDHAELALRG